VEVDQVEKRLDGDVVRIVGEPRRNGLDVPGEGESAPAAVRGVMGRRQQGDEVVRRRDRVEMTAVLYTESSLALKAQYQASARRTGR